MTPRPGSRPPSPDNRIEPADHRLGVGSSQSPHLGGEPFPEPSHGLFARFDQQLPVAIPANVKPQKVEAVFEADDTRLVLVDLQPSRCQPGRQLSLDLFGLLTAFAHRNKIICIPHEHGASRHHPIGVNARCAVTYPCGLLHTVQGHIQ